MRARQSTKGCARDRSALCARRSAAVTRATWQRARARPTMSLARRTTSDCARGGQPAKCARGQGASVARRTAKDCARGHDTLGFEEARIARGEQPRISRGHGFVSRAADNQGLRARVQTKGARAANGAFSRARSATKLARRSATRLARHDLASRVANNQELRAWLQPKITRAATPPVSRLRPLSSHCGGRAACSASGRA